MKEIHQRKFQGNLTLNIFFTENLFHVIDFIMPSDSKKKEMQRKKDARNKKATGAVKKEDKAENGTSSNGLANKEMTEEEELCGKFPSLFKFATQLRFLITFS